VIVVVAIAAAYGRDGALSTLAALALAPVAVTTTWLLADRLAGRRFAAAAAAVYVLLPALGTLYMLGSYRSTFRHDALPNLVGLRGTPWFALGIALALVALARGSAVAFLAAAVVAAVKGAGDLGAIRLGLHETAWSITLLEWLVLASVFGVARRAPVRAVVLGGWLVAAVLHAARQGYDGAAFWQSLSVATPAIAVLLSSLWLLVPRLRPAPAPTRAN
jgi:hypothetical protein